MLAFRLYANCQKDSPILAGYDQTNYRRYFDSINKQSKSTIESLNHSYDCWVVFKLDTLGKVYDYELIEIPEAPLPALAKEYLKNIFFSTSGKWTYQNKKPTTSEDMLFSILLRKESQSIENYVKDTTNTFEFLLIVLPKLPRLKGVNTDNGINITLFY
jgi:hypothetical protein